MAKVDVNSLGRLICRAVGLDPDKVVDVRVRCQASEVSRIDVSMLINEDEAKDIAKAVASSEWTKEKGELDWAFEDVSDNTMDVTLRANSEVDERRGEAFIAEQILRGDL